MAKEFFRWITGNTRVNRPRFDFIDPLDIDGVENALDTEEDSVRTVQRVLENRFNLARSTDCHWILQNQHTHASSLRKLKTISPYVRLVFLDPDASGRYVTLKRENEELSLGSLISQRWRWNGMGRAVIKPRRRKPTVP